MGGADSVRTSARRLKNCVAETALLVLVHLFLSFFHAVKLNSTNKELFVLLVPCVQSCHDVL